MEKVLIVVKTQNRFASKANAFYSGKVVLGKINVGDKVKALKNGIEDIQDCIVRGLAVNKKIVDEAKSGSLINIMISPFDENAYIFTNDLTLLKGKCLLEFENGNNAELSDFLDNRLTIKFPDEFNFSCIAWAGKNKDSQIQLELLYPFYLYVGQKVELKLGDKSICGKVVKII